MVLRKHIALTASATAVAVVSIIGTGAALASSPSTRANHSIQKSLTEGKRATKYEAKLTKAVTKGNLTPNQKTALLNEHSKLEKEFVAAKTLSGVARSKAIRQVWTDAKTWSQSNNVAVHWLIGFKAHHRGMLKASK
jgi:hypothetical protein